MTETDICNLGLGKIGGAGDALNGNAFIDDINGSDKVSSWCKLAFPRIRRKVISELATSLAPFRSTIRFADLGAQVASDSLPEIGNYKYAFNIPKDCLTVVSQFIEGSIASRDQRAYKDPGGDVFFNFEVIANKKGNGKLLLTDYLGNEAGTSAFVEYVIDTPKTGGFTEGMIDCIASLLASEVAPVIAPGSEGTKDTVIFMKANYDQIAVPFAKKENLAGFDNSPPKPSDYYGGRSKRIGSL